MSHATDHGGRGAGRLLGSAVAAVVACGALIGAAGPAAADEQPIIFYAGHPDDYQPGPPSDIASNLFGFNLQSLPVPPILPSP